MTPNLFIIQTSLYHSFGYIKAVRRHHKQNMDSYKTAINVFNKVRQFIANHCMQILLCNPSIKNHQHFIKSDQVYSIDPFSNLHRVPNNYGKSARMWLRRTWQIFIMLSKIIKPLPEEYLLEN